MFYANQTFEWEPELTPHNRNCTLIQPKFVQIQLKFSPVAQVAMSRNRVLILRFCVLQVPVSTKDGKPKPNAKKVTAYGPGLEPGNVLPGKPAHFTVDSSETGKAPVEVVVFNSKGQKVPRKPTISEKADGNHDVSYVPPPVGEPYEVRTEIYLRWWIVLAHVNFFAASARGQVGRMNDSKVANLLDAPRQYLSKISGVFAQRKQTRRRSSFCLSRHFGIAHRSSPFCLQICVMYGGVEIPDSPFEMTSNPDLEDVIEDPRTNIRKRSKDTTEAENPDLVYAKNGTGLQRKSSKGTSWLKSPFTYARLNSFLEPSWTNRFDLYGP